jgi:hypothetical protein
MNKIVISLLSVFLVCLTVFFTSKDFHRYIGINWWVLDTKTGKTHEYDDAAWKDIRATRTVQEAKKGKFDISTARPIDEANKGKFDITTARPIDEVINGEFIPARKE